MGLDLENLLETRYLCLISSTILMFDLYQHILYPKFKNFFMTESLKYQNKIEKKVKIKVINFIRNDFQLFPKALHYLIADFLDGNMFENEDELLVFYALCETEDNIFQKMSH